MKTISDVKLSYLVKKLLDKISLKSDLNHTHKYAGSSSVGGSADSANKLSAQRSLKVDLTKNSTAVFDGTADATMGVNGILPVTNGGTGVSNLDSLIKDKSILRIKKFEYTGTGDQWSNLDLTIPTPIPFSELLMVMIQKQDKGESWYGTSDGSALIIIKGTTHITGYDVSGDSARAEYQIAGLDVTMTNNKITLNQVQFGNVAPIGRCINMNGKKYNVIAIGI